MWLGDITNLTRPCALIAVAIGSYASALSSVITVGRSPGGQVTAWTVAGGASAVGGASGVDGFELPQAATTRQASDVQARMV